MKTLERSSATLPSRPAAPRALLALVLVLVFDLACSQGGRVAGPDEEEASSAIVGDVPQQRASGAYSARTFDSDQANDILIRLYLATLFRTPDPSGMGTYLPLVMNGRLPVVIDAIVTSPEFESRRPTLDAVAWATHLYRQLLDREPEPGAAEATAQPILGGIASRRILDIVLSPEYAAKNLGAGIDQASFVAMDVPAQMAPGATAQVSVSFRNTGTNTWRGELAHRLGSQAPQDNGTWGLGRVMVAPGELVPPGQVKTFAFTITAPTSPGTYDFEWRMLKEHVRWFGDFSSKVSVRVTSCTPSCGSKICGQPDGCGGSCQPGSGCCVAKCDGNSGGQSDGCGGTCSIDRNASFVSMDAPTEMSPGQEADVAITFRNSGNVAWTAASAHRLGSQAPQDNGIWGTGRVFLDASDRVEPGQTKTFRFRIRAPSTPGSYGFQWRMLEELVTWFGDFTPPRSIGVGATVCSELAALNGTSADASSTIQRCVDRTPAGGLLLLPPGRYLMKDAVTVTERPITLGTQGKSSSDPKCALSGASGCAELVADPALHRIAGFLQVSANGSVVDHLVLDGNRQARTNTPSYNTCASGSNGYGYNMRLMCSNCTVTNSVSKNALCGTALEVAGRGSHVRVANNTIASNGVHGRSGLWADGITVHDYPDSVFVDNEIIDNTDIDFVLGGCARCVVQRNVIRHTNGGEGSYAALMIQAWPNGTSGDYSGADFSGNTIDCGPQKACGFGILIGSDPWYSAPIRGGHVHHNTIANPQQGLTIEDASDFVVHHNPVTGRAATTRVSCAPSSPRATSDYSMGVRASNIDISGDNPPMQYVQTGASWIGCIPNWGL